MKNTHMKNDQAVSPVIGVIAGNMEIGACTMPHIIGGETYGRDKSLVLNYWFASTVILAAVIAAFVFGMAGQITKTKVVAMSVQKITPTSVSVTNMGGQDVGSLSGVSVDIDGNTTVQTSGNLGKNVGSSSIFASNAGRVRVVVIGTFTDSDSSQVLIDTFI